LILAGAIGGVIAVAASLVTARSILRPLRGLEETAYRVAGGDLDARAGTTGPTEFAHLGQVMNEMVSRLQTREEELLLSNDELRERNRQLIEARTVAATDPVTGIPNHRRFQESIRAEIASAERAGSPLSLLMLDIDRFKAINDAFGHLEGDRILRELGLILAKIDGDDHAFRYGGDEFAVLLPGCTLSEARSIADTVRTNARSIDLGDGRQVTISLGVSSFPETATSPDELIYGADAAMYRAKAGGKDRVEAAAEAATARPN
jgi:diguanylate cyclase